MPARLRDRKDIEFLVRHPNLETREEATEIFNSCYPKKSLSQDEVERLEDCFGPTGF
jgi:hypothetical protein